MRESLGIPTAVLRWTCAGHVTLKSTILVRGTGGSSQRELIPGVDKQSILNVFADGGLYHSAASSNTGRRGQRPFRFQFHQMRLSNSESMEGAQFLDALKKAARVMHLVLVYAAKKGTLNVVAGASALLPFDDVVREDEGVAVASQAGERHGAGE